MKNFKSLIFFVCLLAATLSNINAQSAGNETVDMSASGEYAVTLLAARKQFENKNYDGAIIELNKILKKMPNDIVALQIRAESYYRLKKLDQSLADLDKIIAANVEFVHVKAPAYAWRGLIRFKQNNHGAAISDAKAALALDGRIDLAYDVLRESSTFEQYGAELSRLIALLEKKNSLSHIPQPYSERALFLLKSTWRYDLAASDALKALQLDTSVALKTRSLLWEILEMHYEDEVDLYIEELTKIIDYSNQNTSDALFHRARSYYNQKKYDLAIADLTKAISQLDSAARRGAEGADYFSLRARSYYGLDKEELAAADLDKVFKAEFAWWYDYHLRAQLYCKMGKKTEAKADEKMVIELGYQSKITKPCQ